MEGGSACEPVSRAPPPRVPGAGLRRQGCRLCHRDSLGPRPVKAADLSPGSDGPQWAGLGGRGAGGRLGLRRSGGAGAETRRRGGVRLAGEAGESVAGSGDPSLQPVLEAPLGSPCRARGPQMPLLASREPLPLPFCHLVILSCCRTASPPPPVSAVPGNRWGWPPRSQSPLSLGPSLRARGTEGSSLECHQAW